MEKAKMIRERRELEMDLEAVKEGEKRWGNRRPKRGTVVEEDEEKEEQDGEEQQPKPRLARGLQGLDFLNDDDGEETD